MSKLMDQVGICNGRSVLSAEIFVADAEIRVSMYWDQCVIEYQPSFLYEFDLWFEQKAHHKTPLRRLLPGDKCKLEIAGYEFTAYVQSMCALHSMMDYSTVEIIFTIDTRAWNARYGPSPAALS